MIGWNRRCGWLVAWSVACCVAVPSVVAAELETAWLVGAAKIDITPDEPVRLSGYASRSEPTEAIDDRLSARALVLEPVGGASASSRELLGSSQRQPLVIVSIDAIGISAVMTERVLEPITSRLGIPRSRVVLCTTHAHTAPHLDGVIPNLFGPPLSEAEQKASVRYSERLVSQIVDVVMQAAAGRRPGNVEFGLGRAEFAINRRMIKNEQWVGIGTVDDGPVDRNVRVVRAIDASGVPIAVAYQYACHSTSISPEANRLSGDWAGISAAQIEAQLPNCIALPIIGCGADANPNPRGTIEDARRHGKEMAASVLAALSGTMKPLPMPTLATFTLVALASERPTAGRLKEMQSSPSAHERNFANHWLGVLQRKDRIPETYPAPVHYWTFGDELAWVFMGGEVVVDYQIRFERELSQFSQVWVAGYVDDVFAYVASERVRKEGGYESEGSMLYYQQPGRWVTGTEDTIVDRVLQLSKQMHPAEEPMSPEESLATIEVPEGWVIELMAAEPLVTDPVNIAFGSDGKVWVVEMGDYPLGGGKTGCIKYLVDTDGDGRLDRSQVFLDGLHFPAGVYAWRDGVVIACAPEIFFARDRDGDGVCDERIPLLSGFPEGNPQHRVHGFTYGLDHRLYFGPGGGADTITATGTGVNATSPPKDFRVAGSDISLDPDTASMRLETGVTQYIRATDDWGQWYGNENSLPMFHYVYSQRWMERAQTFPRKRYQLMTDPPSIPPVFPISQQADRFNDLYAINRFTSACSTIINRGAGQGESMRGMALVCEPVHNLVTRFKVEPQGASWSAQRLDADAKSEFVRSRDPWFRPVRIENAPDGSLWIVDMYRYVIEHPEWIPEEWQRRIPVRAGEDRGRIYRIRRGDYTPKPIVDLRGLEDERWVAELTSGNAGRADLAQQLLIERHRDVGLSMACLSKLRQAMMTAFESRSRARAAATLIAIGKCTPAQFELMLGVGDARWLRFMLDQLDRMPDPAALRGLLWSRVKSDRIRESASLAVAMAIESSYAQPCQPDKIAWALAEHATDRWVQDGVGLLAPESIDGVLGALLPLSNEGEVEKSPAVHGLVESLIPRASGPQRERMLQAVVGADGVRPAWHYVLARQMSSASVKGLDGQAIEGILGSARETLSGSVEASLPTRRAAMELLFSRMGSTWGDDHELLSRLLANADGGLEAGLVQGLVRTGNEAASRLLKMWDFLSPVSRATLLSELAKKAETIRLLLSAMGDGGVSTGDIDASTLQQVRSTATEDLAAEVLERFGPAPGSDRAEVVRLALARWPQRAERSLGQAAYQKHCAVCHEPKASADRPEESLAPALAGLGHWSNEAWLTAILDPSRSVEEKYWVFQAKTEDGELITGLKRREDETSIEWVNAAGRVDRADKSQLTDFKMSERSLMPDGFEQLMSPEEIAGIVSYLRSRSAK
jgi:putative membrane-bound dehydrogenase-like protein